MILKKIRNIVRWVVVLFFSTTILAVVAYRFIPVYVTPLMIIRCFQQVADGESITLHHHWVSMDKISPHMPVAVMASEDARFLKHHGFDFNAIESAAKNNARVVRCMVPVQSVSRPPRTFSSGRAVPGPARDLRCISPFSSK